MDLGFYVRVRTCKKRVTGKQPLGGNEENMHESRALIDEVRIQIFKFCPTNFF